MKKLSRLLMFPLLLLASCQPTETSFSSSTPTSSTPSSSENSTSTSTAIEPETTFSSITSLIDYLDDGDARYQEQKLVSGYTREYSSYDIGILDLHKQKQITEVGTFYSNDAFSITRVLIDSKIDEAGLGMDEMNTYHIKELKEISDGTYYEILDNQEDPDSNKATKEEVTDSKLSTYQANTTCSLSTTLLSYISVIQSQIIEGADDITPEIDETTGASTYTFARSMTQSSSDYSLITESKFEISFTQDCTLSGYSYESTVKDEDGVLQTSEKDVVTCSFDKKEEYDASGFIDPVDYFLTDYEIQLAYYDGVEPGYTNVEVGADFPYDYYVKALVINPTPSKAVDKDLTITASSDENVIKVTTYEDGTSAEAVGEGTTTLTVKSESGIEKTIDVTVAAPALTSIEANLYSSHHFVGDKECLYITKNPENSLDEIETISLTEDLISISQDDRGYTYLNYLAAGEGKVRVQSKVDSSVYVDVTVNIETKKTLEEMKTIIVGTWSGDFVRSGQETQEDVVHVTLNADGSGTFVFGGTDSFYPFEKDKSYAFTYTLPTSLDSTATWMDVTLSSFTAGEGENAITYGNNSLRFYLNGTDCELSLSPEDSNYYFYMFGSDLTKDAA